MARERRLVGLTTREFEVLYGISLGFSNDEIGDVLGIFPTTVRTHIQSIYSKLGDLAGNGPARRTEALWLAERQGLRPADNVSKHAYKRFQRLLERRLHP